MKQLKNAHLLSGNHVRETHEMEPTPKENHEASPEVLDAENKCKYCEFIVEGKLKPSKIYQKIKAHENKNHNTSKINNYQVSSNEGSFVPDSDHNSLDLCDNDEEQDSDSDEDEDVMELNHKKLNTPWYLYENSDEEEYSDSETEYDTDESSDYLEQSCASQIKKIQEENKILKGKLQNFGISDQNVSTLTGSPGLESLELNLEKRDNFLEESDSEDEDENLHWEPHGGNNSYEFGEVTAEKPKNESYTSLESPVINTGLDNNTAVVKTKA